MVRGFIGVICWLIALPAVALVSPGQRVAPDQNAPLIWQQIRAFEHAPLENEESEVNGDVLVLEAGESARFPIETGRYLRLDSEMADLPGLDGLEVQQSSDGAWFYPLAMSKTTPDGVRVSLQPVDGDRAIRLHNDGGETLRFRVSEGEYRPVPEEVTWQPESVGQMPEVTLRRHPQAALQHVQSLQRTDAHEFTLEGPALYALSFRETQNRLSTRRRGRISVALDDQSPDVHYLHFTTDRRHRYQLGRESLLLSHAERYYLWVPEGDHQVALRSDNDLWLEVLRAEHHRSTSVGSSRPWMETLAVVRDRLLFQQQQTQWAIHEVLTRGAGAAELAAASFDSKTVEGWQSGYLDNVFRRRYTQERVLWPVEGSTQQWLTPLKTEFALTVEDDLYYARPEQPKDRSEGYFQVASQKRTLALPRTQGPTRLKISLTNPQQPVTLSIRYGEQQQLLRFEPFSQQDPDQRRLTAPSQERLQRLSSAPKVLVSDVVLPLPQGVNNVSVKAIEGKASMRMAVEEGRWPEFTEQEFWDYLNDLGAGVFLSSWQSSGHRDSDFVDRLGSKSGVLDVARVFQDSQFLRDWLGSRYQNFVDDLSPALSAVPPEKVRTNLNSLPTTDEPALARRYAEGVFVHSANADNKRQAFRVLKQMFIKHGDEYALQSLLATAFVHHDQMSVLPDIALIMERNGYDQVALKLALVLLESGRLEESRRQEMHELALRTAVLADWPLTLDHLAEVLPATEQKAWRQLHVQENYGFNDPSVASEWHHPITDFMAKMPESNAVPAEAWLSLFRRDYPGSWRWRDWPFGFQGPVERVNVHNPDLNRFYQRQRISPNTPLNLTVTGPVRLRINTALLHRERTSRLNDQLMILHNDQDYRFSIINSGVFNRHRIIGAGSEFPGSVETIEATLGPGEHRLVIAPGKQSALVNIELNTPEFMSRSYLAAQTQACDLGVAEWPQLPGERALPTKLSMVAPHWVPDLTENNDQCRRFRADAKDASDLQDDYAGAMQTFMLGSGVRFSPTPTSAGGELLPPTPSRPQPLDRVSQYLSQVLATPGFSRRPSLIARSNALAAAYPDALEVQQKLGAINAEQGWQQEELVLESAGIQQFDSSDWPPSLPFLRYRYDLLAESPAVSEQLLSGMDPIVVAVNDGGRGQYRLKVRLDKVGFQRVSPVTVAIQVNGEHLSRFNLSEVDSNRRVPLNLSSGPSQIELQLLNPSSRHSVYFQLEQRNGPDSGWQAVVREQNRRYYKVLPGQPLELYVDQPTWLRLEVFDGQRRVQQYRYHPVAGNLVISAEDLSGSYVRVYGLRHQPGRLTAQPPSPTPAMTPTPEHPLQRANAPLPSALVSTGLPNPDREAGTHGVYADWVQRRNFDGGSDLERERFVELGWRYQQNPLFSRFYWQSDVFYRSHSSEDIALLGSQQWLTWRPDNRYWRLNLNAGGFWQLGDSAGSLNLRATLDGYMPLSNHWTLEHEVSGFARYLSEGASGSRTTSYDDDVFTVYKSNHRHGLDWTESLSYRPWRDSRFLLDAQVRSNEDLSPDRFVMALRWDQFWLHNTRTYLGIQQRWLQKDDDRPENDSQQIVEAGLEWHMWQNRGRRWFVRLDTGLDLDVSEPSLKVSFGMDAPGTKRLEDYRQERFSFFDLNEMNAARSVDTNELNYVE